jgi:protein-S-isoprenylcysteine O-methyltransferase Ste14
MEQAHADTSPSGLGAGLYRHRCRRQLPLRLAAHIRVTNHLAWHPVDHWREGTEIDPNSTTNRKLVTTGPYRFTRNPMYLGWAIVTLGVACLIGTWPMFVASIAFFATMNWVQIPFEEVKMRRQFGEVFDSYTREVRRWV